MIHRRWSFYGTIMFAKPVAIGTAVTTPYWIYLHYTWEKEKEERAFAEKASSSAH